MTEMTPARRLGALEWDPEDIRRFASTLDRPNMLEVARLAELGLVASDIDALLEKGVPLDKITSVRVGTGKAKDNVIVIDDAPRSIAAVRRSGRYEDGKWISPGGLEQFRPKTGGMLNRGGTRGHRGGGQPPKVVREKLRDMFLKNLDVLEKIANDKKQSAAARMKALDMMAEYGVGRASAVLDRDGNEQDTQLIIREVQAPPKRVRQEELDIEARIDKMLLQHASPESALEEALRENDALKKSLAARSGVDEDGDE